MKITQYLFISLLIIIFSCISQKDGKQKNNQSTIKSLKKYTIYAASNKLYSIGKGNRDSLFSINYGTYTIYNNSKPIKRFRNFPNSNIKDKIVWTYDKNGNELKGTKFKDDGSIYSYWKNTYDKNAKLIEKSWYSGKTKVVTEKYKYDTLGNKIEMLYYSKIMNESNHYYYKYNENKELIKEKYFANGQTQISLYKYDTLGNKIEEVVSGGILGYSKSIYQYNEYSSLIKKEEFDANDKLKTTINLKYIYDDKKNWVTKKLSIDGNPKSITEREYKYLN